MTRRRGRAFLVGALLTLSAGEAAPGAERGTDELGVDFYQQNDFYTTTLNKPQSTAQFYQRQVNWMLENQYPPASIIMSSVSRGMTLADTVFFMSRAQPGDAESIYELAVDIMPVLPGWACSADSGLPNRYDREIDSGELPSSPSLEQLARLYFDDGKRYMEYPEWEQNKGHTEVSVDELIRFKEREMDTAGNDSWWYRPDQRVKTDVIMVSLYPTNRRVVIDARHRALQQMKSSGTTKVPVMLLYTELGQIPMSDLSSIGDSGEISAGAVISRFDATKERVSPTRDWHKGDHHLQAQTSELQSLFQIPDKEDIQTTDWQRWEKKLDQGLEKPLMISLYESGDNRWLDESGLVAVAADKGVAQLPVVFFYHSSQRQVCGLPAACTDQLKEAIIKGSGRDDLFGSPNDRGSPRQELILRGGDGPKQPPASPS